MQQMCVRGGIRKSYSDVIYERLRELSATLLWNAQLWLKLII